MHKTLRYDAIVAPLMTRLQASQRVYGTSSRIGGVRYANPYLLRRSKRVVGKQQFRMTCARRFTASADSRSCSGNPQQSSSRWQATSFSRTLSVPRRDPAVIEIGTRDGRSNEVVVFVRDNGVGFDAGSAERLFGVFERLHSAEEFDGTGIGLANAQRIVTPHGGAMWAAGAIDRGATFFFSLPQTDRA
jgi:Histidine kinase-, DNA gyrase B-, and HSP90-like ATPase